MRRLFRSLALVAGAISILGVAPVANAGHDGDPRTKNLHPLGHIIEPAVLGGFGGANPDINTDIAFRGNLAFGNITQFTISERGADTFPPRVLIRPVRTATLDVKFVERARQQLLVKRGDGNRADADLEAV